MREQRLAEGHLGLSLVEELARQSGGSLDDQLERGCRHPGRARGAVPVIRVAVADDHGVLRDGLAGVIAAQPDMELVGDRRRRSRGGRGLPLVDARRDADGPRDAGHGRDRGDAGDPRRGARDGRARAHVLLRPAADHRSARRGRGRLPAQGRVRRRGRARHPHRRGGRLATRSARRAVAARGEERARPARRGLAARAGGARACSSTACPTS